MERDVDDDPGLRGSGNVAGFCHHKIRKYPSSGDFAWRGECNRRAAGAGLVLERQSIAGTKPLRPDWYGRLDHRGYLLTYQSYKGETMKSKPILLETILVSAVTLIGMWSLPAAKTIFALIPVAYLLIERRIRRRTWTDLGFNFRTLGTDIRTNWFLFALTGFIIQPLTVQWAKTYFPEYLAHSALPFESGISWGVLLPLLAVSLLGEDDRHPLSSQGAGFLLSASPPRWGRVPPVWVGTLHPRCGNHCGCGHRLDHH